MANVTPEQLDRMVSILVRHGFVVLSGPQFLAKLGAVTTVAAAAAAPVQTAPATTRQYDCGKCGGPGHNARTCTAGKPAQTQAAPVTRTAPVSTSTKVQAPPPASPSLDSLDFDSWDLDDAPAAPVQTRPVARAAAPRPAPTPEPTEALDPELAAMLKDLNLVP